MTRSARRLGGRKVDLFTSGYRKPMFRHAVLTPANPCKCEVAQTNHNRTVLTLGLADRLNLFEV